MVSGGGMLFLPSVAIVSTYFTTKRALAIGIVASGGSIGSTIYPIMFRKLQPEVGFPWAIRIIGFIAFATLLLSIAVMRTRLPPMEKVRALFDWAAFTHWPYTIFSIGLFLAYIGLYIPIFYIVIIAQRKANSSTNLSFYLLAILNGASVFGRIIPGLLADRFGAIEVMLTCTLLSALFAYILIAIHSFSGLVVFACFYGFVSGAVVSMPPTVVATLVPNLQVMGTWMGMCFLFAAAGVLIGSPIAGTIINIEEADFKDAFILAGTVILAGGLLFIVARIMSVVEQRKIQKESGSKLADSNTSNISRS
jgi:MFS family permease